MKLAFFTRNLILTFSKYENHDDWDDENGMKKIKDVFKANSLYIKFNEIVYALENRRGFNKILVISVIEKVQEHTQKMVIYHIWE